MPGFEPGPKILEIPMLPLHHTPIIKFFIINITICQRTYFAGVVGFEPTACCFGGSYVALHHTPMFESPVGFEPTIRRFCRPGPEPVRLRRHFKELFEFTVGFEPTKHQLCRLRP